MSGPSPGREAVALAPQRLARVADAPAIAELTRACARRGLGRAILEACERAARDEGFRTLALMATLPGEPLYAAFGFRMVERVTLIMPDGVTLAGVAMERGIDAAPA